MQVVLPVPVRVGIEHESSKGRDLMIGARRFLTKMAIGIL